MGSHTRCQECGKAIRLYNPGADDAGYTHNNRDLCKDCYRKATGIWYDNHGKLHHDEDPETN